MTLRKIVLGLLTAALCLGGCGCAGGGNSAPSTVSENSAPVEQSAPNENSAPAESAADAESEISSTESVSSEESVQHEEVTEPIARDNDYEWDKVIALTFDDGPNTTTTKEVLEVLKKHGVVGTFFLIGDNINDESAKVVKYAYDLGCEINNHSKSHAYMDAMTADEVKAEYEYVDEKVYEITGEHTKFFRPPYIAVGDVMWENIDVPFISGIGCNDWDEKVTADRRKAVILKKVEDGSIILLHDAEGNSQTVEALDALIPELKAQGYKFVTLSELFEEKGVEPVTQKIYSNVMQESMWG